MNNSINLKSLEQLVSEAESRVSRASEEPVKENKMDTFRRIVEGIARKYASKWVDREDLEQELWIKVLEMVAACGGDENQLDDDLVAKACYREAVDYYRYCRRRYESTAAYIPEAFEGEDCDVTEDYTKYYKTHGLVKDTDYAMITEAVNLFAEGSKEREYAIMKLYYYGDLDPEFWGHVDLPEEGTAKNGDYREVDFLKMLGYKGNKIPGSWIVKRNEMRRIIEEYLRGF